MKLIHMPDPDDVIFDIRTLAERVNARLKDEFGARSVRVRGAIKVKCHLMFGVLATRGRSNTPRHAAQAHAGLSAGRSAPRTQGKFAAFNEFCKRLQRDRAAVANTILGLVRNEAGDELSLA